jgi:hypothetical protein
MTDAAARELLAGFIQTIEALERSNTVVRALALAHQVGRRLVRFSRHQRTSHSCSGKSLGVGAAPTTPQLSTECSLSRPVAGRSCGA